MNTPFLSSRCHAGFTLVEISVAVTILGLLAAVAIPVFGKLTKKSVNTLINNEFRVASTAVNHYHFENGSWPPDGAGGWPSELTGYLPPPDRWNQPTPIGGKWAWALNSDSATAALKINDYTVSSAQVLNLDQMIDDGALETGDLIVADTSLVYVLQK